MAPHKLRSKISSFRRIFQRDLFWEDVVKKLVSILLLFLEFLEFMRQQRFRYSFTYKFVAIFCSK